MALSDTFTYSNNDNLETASSSVWKQMSALLYINVNSNKAGVRFTNINYASAYYDTALASANHYAQATISGTIASGTTYNNRGRGVVIRANAGSGASRQGYAVAIHNNAGTHTVYVLQLTATSNGVLPTLITSATCTYSSLGTVLKAQATGSGPVTIDVWVDGVKVINAYSDSTYQYTGLYCGVCGQTEDNTVQIDDWSADVVSGGSIGPIASYYRMLGNS